MYRLPNKLAILVANGLAAVMDFGVGALIAVLLLQLFSLPVTPLALLLGGTLALLPDFDVVPSILLGRNVYFDHHQTLLHRPLLVLFIIGLVSYFLGGEVWLYISLACLVYHYFHDTGYFSLVTGIAWLWPFSPRPVSWWGFYDQIPSDHHVWLKRFWFQPTLKSVTELSTGVAALAGAILIAGLSNIWLLLPLFFVVIILTLWFSH